MSTKPSKEHRQAEPVENRPKIPVQGQGVGQILGALSILLVLLTPVAYLNGRAFHDGWYEYFKLDPYMFPLDTAGMLNNAAMAWLNGFLAVVNVVFTMLITHWERVLLYILFAALIWRSGSWMLGHISRWSARRRATKEARRQSVLRRAVWWIVEPLLGMGISISMIYLMCFGLSMIVFLLVAPFDVIGRHEAKLQAERNFHNMPVVTLKSPTGEQVEYHIIGCGTQFCGLFGNAHAITVPVSAITWAVSPSPDH